MSLLPSVESSGKRPYTSGQLEAELVSRMNAVARSWPAGAVGLFLIGIAVLLGFYSLILARQHTYASVDHSRDLVVSAQALIQELTDAETGQLLFVVTGDKRFIGPYTRAISNVPGSVSSLRSITAGNPGQQQRLQEVDSLAQQKLSDIGETIRIRQDHGDAAARNVIRMDRGKTALGSIRALVFQIEAEEKKLLGDRIREREASLARLWLVASCGAASGLILIVIGYLSKFRTQQNLRDREIQFHILADSIAQLCWMATREGYIFWYNQRWYEYTGTTAEKMAGWGWQSVHDPDTLPAVMDSWQASIATGTPFEMVFPLLGADGVFRPFLTRVVPVRDQSGKIDRWFGTNTDIAEQRRIEQALRESEERLRLAQQVARVGTFDWDIRTGVNRWTPELESMYGLRPGAFASTTHAWEALMHPEDRPKAVEKMRVSMENGRFEGEWRVIWPDNTIRWIYGRGWVFKDEAGKPLRMIGVNIDITERKTAEQALRDSEIRYATLTEALPAIIYTTSADGETDYVNSRWQEYTGLRYEESDPQSFNSPVHPEDRRVVEDRWSEARRNGLGYETEFRLRRADGLYRWFRCRVVPLQNEQGLVVKWLGISSDIDDEKKAEDRLRQSQKMEAIGRLAGGVAHDFNNLLTGISGFNSMLMDALGDQPELFGFASEVQGAAERAGALTRQLLTFSRRERSEPKILDLNEVVLSMRTLLGRVIGEDIEIVTVLEPDIGHVLIDPVQLDQIIMNLAVNARDAMPDGGRLTFETETLSVSPDEAGQNSAIPGVYVTLEVIDSGSGMDAETRSRLFEPFFTTKEEGKGTGLGLATVYGTVCQNGGFISVESEPGAGARFKVYLPKCLDTALDKSAPEPIQAALNAGADQTVVLVEDDRTVRQFAAALLIKQGYRVIEAGTPGDAIKLVGECREPILALVTDVLMAEMRGTELAKRLRESRPGLPVLYISGYSDRTFLSPRALEGAAYLQKPFTASELSQALRKMLAGAPGVSQDL